MNFVLFVWGGQVALSVNALGKKGKTSLLSWPEKGGDL